MAFVEKVALGKAVTRAWTDPEFRAKLLQDPGTTLRDAGVKIPPDVTVKVVENTKQEVYVVLPPPSAAEEVTPDSLHVVDTAARRSPFPCISDGV